MNPQPTQLEKFQQQRIEAMETQIKQMAAEKKQLELQLSFEIYKNRELSALAKIGRAKVIQTTKNPVFDKPISNITINN